MSRWTVCSFKIQGVLCGACFCAVHGVGCAPRGLACCAPEPHHNVGISTRGRGTPAADAPRPGRPLGEHLSITSFTAASHCMQAFGCGVGWGKFRALPAGLGLDAGLLVFSTHAALSQSGRKCTSPQAHAIWPQPMPPHEPATHTTALRAPNDGCWLNPATQVGLVYALAGFRGWHCMAVQAKLFPPAHSPWLPHGTISRCVWAPTMATQGSPTPTDRPH